MIGYEGKEIRILTKEKGISKKKEGKKRLKETERRRRNRKRTSACKDDLEQGKIEKRERETVGA